MSLMIKVCPFLAFKFDLEATPNSTQELSLYNRPTRQRISNKRMRSKRTMSKRLTIKSKKTHSLSQQFMLQHCRVATVTGAIFFT